MDPLREFTEWVISLDDVRSRERRTVRLVDVILRAKKALEENDADQEECSALLFHGGGHQSRTHCYLVGRHDVHETVYVNTNTGSEETARWRDGQYRDKLVAKKIDVPVWVNDGTAMTGFFDEAPQVDD